MLFIRVHTTQVLPGTVARAKLKLGWFSGVESRMDDAVRSIEAARRVVRKREYEQSHALSSIAAICRGFQIQCSSSTFVYVRAFEAVVNLGWFSGVVRGVC